MESKITDYGFFKQLEALPFIEQIWLFGSRARGDNEERSDIDIAISCPAATSEDWLKVLDIIEQADTLLKIDCVRVDDLGPNDKFTENVLKFKKIIYKK